MLRDKKLFLFDIDGTLAVGDMLLDGTRELLEYIERIVHYKQFYQRPKRLCGKIPPLEPADNGIGFCDCLLRRMPGYEKEI